MSTTVEDQLISAAEQLRDESGRLRFRLPVAHVYNPLEYAWEPHEQYLRKFGGGRKRVLFVGMNPGPFGMMQTGVPFGEIRAVREWMKIDGKVVPPEKQHVKAKILGFECPRSEVSGRRLWGLFEERFGAPKNFFAEHFVANYCPLAFLEAGGANYAAERFNKATSERLHKVCDKHLKAVIAALDPEWVIGVGGFAAGRLREVVPERKVGQILHPSPACPAANRDWVGTVTRQLRELGVWK
ncbi:MAG: smuG [Verrucomicrobiales bacterium]|nr:smuG [Verrucomicrobiales bacterium]